jgi:small-conductance mechanosensitive channel
MASPVIRRVTLLFLLLWAVLCALLSYGAVRFPAFLRAGAGDSALRWAAVIAGILTATQFLKVVTQWTLSRRGKPPAEAQMVGRLFDLVGGVGILLAFAGSMGKLGAFGAMFAAFGGMLLGWSLQAPVSGFAAWVLVSIKRPFRPGDRIQLPSLGLTGDVKDVGLMYTMLNQVGGSIGSEEAVGRYILLPNAMLFSQVVINYTVLQDSPYMLDEVVIRITYDSDWEEAEAILLRAAEAATGDIIQATGMRPYIRSDMYDYGVYLRLRYQTRVKDRAEIAYKITKSIFTDVQRTPRVDMAIPFIYSNRAALEQREGGGTADEDLDISRIHPRNAPVAQTDVDQLAGRIQTDGLLQPIIVAESERSGYYDLVAGDIRLAAAKKLNWRTIPAVIQRRRPPPSHGAPAK